MALLSRSVNVMMGINVISYKNDLVMIGKITNNTSLGFFKKSGKINFDSYEFRFVLRAPVFNSIICITKRIEFVMKRNEFATRAVRSVAKAIRIITQRIPIVTRRIPRAMPARVVILIAFAIKLITFVLNSKQMPVNVKSN